MSSSEQSSVSMQGTYLSALQALEPGLETSNAEGMEKILAMLKASAGVAFGATALALGSPILAVFAPFIDRLLDAFVPSFEKHLIVDRIELLHRCVLELTDNVSALSSGVARADASITALNQSLKDALDANPAGQVYDLVRQSVRAFEAADSSTQEHVLRITAYSLTQGARHINKTKQLLDAVLSLSDSDKHILLQIIHLIPESNDPIRKVGAAALVLDRPQTLSEWRRHLKPLGISEKALQIAFVYRIYHAGFIDLTEPADPTKSQLRRTELTKTLCAFIPRVSG